MRCRRAVASVSSSTSIAFSRERHIATLAPISGPVAVFGDYVPADAVLPARFGFLPANEAANHVLEELGPGTSERVRAHPILLAGEAFGYGTGRESPARALRAAGVKALVAISFGRMFYRNAINNGILTVVCAELVKAGPTDGERVEIDTAAARLRWKNHEFRIGAVAPLLQEIIAAGDLIAHGRKIHG